MKIKSLSDISYTIDNELDQFSSLFKENMRSNVPLVDLIARYIIRQKGKKIRPLLVLLSAKATGTINERTYRGALLVELLHTATLVHDDVVDNADKRRGFWSINAVFKNKAAVLMGDYLLSRGLNISVDGNDFDFLRVMTNTVKRMAEGELLQIQKTRKLDINEKEYFQVISDKTASLLETCTSIGALSATDDPAIHETMRVYGESLGIAFQIKDDILDYEGSSSIIGKPVGGDIKEKKITLPLIYALENSSKDEQKKIKKLIKNGNSIKYIIDYTKQNGGIDYAKKTASVYAKKAKEALKPLLPSESRNGLIDLVDFVIERSK